MFGATVVLLYLLKSVCLTSKKSEKPIVLPWPYLRVQPVLEFSLPVQIE
jgi:hypothetical protein